VGKATNTTNCAANQKVNGSRTIAMVTAIRTSYSIRSLLIGVVQSMKTFLAKKKTGTHFSVAGFTTRSLKSRGDHVGISVHRIN
jgi:hypothetical protein